MLWLGMNTLSSAALVNLVGFTTGAALYALLLWMVARRSPNKLLLATALLGLAWNVGGLAAYGARDFGFAPSLPLVLTLAYAALGFLPAVVVNLALPAHTRARWLAWTAYALSGAAALSHLRGAWTGAGPSPWALKGLTAGYVALLAALFWVTRRQKGNRRAAWASALAVFALSALHLSGHGSDAAESWWAELAGHHSSVLLALVILYQDYRFAFADLFLKRALSLLLLVALAVGLYAGLAAPLAARRGPLAVVALLGLWVLTALVYPALRQASHWFVEQVALRRPDYAALRLELAAQLARHETPTEVLQAVCQTLTPALSARDVGWLRSDSVAENETPPALARFAQWQRGAATECVEALPPEAEAGALIFVPTAEPPFYTLVAGPLEGGRRLLSDDTAFLEAVALLTARRLDVLRVTRERYEKDLRAQEISKLATEAQLRALRAQINPHFLFNALTTIGYLIQTAPERALETLLKLTDLLRGALRETGEFVTLDEELKIIAAYLDIEQARFEERLRARVAVPEELRRVRVPSLLLQPLVENAVKHGIAPAKNGGEVSLTAQVETINGQPFLVLRVSDTGTGASPTEMARGRERGVGLGNIEQRLRSYCGEAASLLLTAAPGAGATAELRLPLNPDGTQVLFSRP
jgi:two-component system LytT family sensor kinase